MVGSGGIFPPHSVPLEEKSNQLPTVRLQTFYYYESYNEIIMKYVILIAMTWLKIYTYSVSSPAEGSV